jgi:DNA uptake protein ComE-like DNA-binding protein
MYMRLMTCALLTCVLGGLAACTSSQNPDEIRRKTAEDTATLKRDTKAVAEGIKEGLTNKNSIDLNHASKADLSSLPGVTDREADRIIAERPYANTHQLVTRHVLTDDEYGRIQDRVVAGR